MVATDVGCCWRSSNNLEGSGQFEGGCRVGPSAGWPRCCPLCRPCLPLPTAHCSPLLVLCAIHHHIHNHLFVRPLSPPHTDHRCSSVTTAQLVASRAGRSLSHPAHRQYACALQRWTRDSRTILNLTPTPTRLSTKACPSPIPPFTHRRAVALPPPHQRQRSLPAAGAE